MFKTVTLSNGFQMPMVGFGCGGISAEKAEVAICTALDAGYRLFDCALLYDNESYIGDAFENIFKEGKYSRSDVFITTKLPMIGNQEDRVEEFLKRSLENLKLSYVDLYLIHFPVGFAYNDNDDFFPKVNGIIQLDYSTDILKVWKGMEAQVDSGRTKSIGVSNFNTDQISRVLNSARIRPVNLQVEVHAYFQQKPLRSFCEKHRIVVSAFGPLGSPGRKEAFKHNGVPEVMTDPLVVKIAKKYGKDPSQVLLHFLQAEAVIALPKSSQPERIRQNINIFDFNLTEEEMVAFRSLDKGEEGRSFDFSIIFQGLEHHPENPCKTT